VKQLLVFAHPLEAAPTVESFEAQLVGRNLYRFEGGLISISGMGALAAACAVAQLAGAVDEVVNLGLCGAIGDAFEIESFHWIGQVGKHVPGRTSRLDPFPPIGEEGVRLLTCDTPLYDRELRDELSADWDLVDMEGYGVAMAAERVGLPWRLGKIVSDKAVEGSFRELRERLPDLARRLAHSPTSV